MSLTVKESPELNNPGKPGSSTQNSENKSAKPGEAPRPNPVCLEVPVTIRSLPGQNDNPSLASGPTREEGRTVIVFDNGAVLRLSNTLPAGQTMIVSNAQGRDVVCRIVQGRNLPSVKGYVEVEFLEPVNDFWRIHETTQPSAGFPTAAPVLPSPLVPPAAAPVTSPAKEANASSGNAPSFEDIVGVVRMSPPPAGRAKSQAPAGQKGSFKSRDEVAYGKVTPAKSDSVTSELSPIAEDPANELVISPVQRPSPLAFQKQAPPRDFMATGMLASGRSSSSSSSASRGPMPLILGGAALALAGLGAGYFFLYGGNVTKTIAPSPVASQPSTPSSPAASIPSEMSHAKIAPEPAPTLDQTPPPVASVSAETPASIPTEAQTSRKPASTPAAKQPDQAATRREAIPNLKMKSPVAPRQNQAKLSEGSAPNVTDIPSAVPGGAAPTASLMSPMVRSVNEPAPPPSLLPPVSASNKEIREPRLITSTRPMYPPMAKQTGVQGKVEVSAQVGVDGSVANAKAISGPMLLRDAAVYAVQRWKYSPELIDGKPAAAQITVTVEFRLN
jgi:protein TonB